MECLFEAILQIFGELFLGAFLEFLADLIGRGVSGAFRRVAPAKVREVASTPLEIGIVVLWLHIGAAIGGLSLLVLPRALIHGAGLRLANVLISPFLMAGGMVAWGRYLARQDRKRSALNHFAASFAFAASYLLVRYWFAK